MPQLIARRSTDVEWAANHFTEIDGRKVPVLNSKLYLNPARDPAYLRLVEYCPGLLRAEAQPYRR